MTFMMKHNRDHNQNAVWEDCVVLIFKEEPASCKRMENDTWAS